MSTATYTLQVSPCSQHGELGWETCVQPGFIHINNIDHNADILWATCFNQPPLENVLTSNGPPAEIRRRLQEQNVTDIYVNWSEIDRYRAPHNYGFSEKITHELFERLVAYRVLEPVELPWETENEAYRVWAPEGDTPDE